jgi:long-chain acyl-CoA synthetase
MRNLADAVFRVAREAPDRPAFWYGEDCLTYGAFAGRVRRLAEALEDLGLRPGERVGILLYNTPEFATAYFALLSLGAVVVPLNTRLTGPELETILRDAEARLLLTSSDFEDPVAWLAADLERTGLERIIADLEEFSLPGRAGEFPRPLPANALATLIYTSGTTGRPKGVMLSHVNLLADASANVEVIEATAEDRFITVSPLFHVFGQTNILISAMLAGAGVVLIPKFSPRRILDAIVRYRVTFLAAVPTMYLMMLSHLREKEDAFDLSSLRVCHSGAAPLAVETFREVERYFGAPAQEGYGLSEASSIVCSNPLRGVRKPGSVGLPLRGIRVRIRRDGPDGAWEESGPGEIGELYVQGDVVMQGYYKQPEETAKALVACPDGSRWLRTRDLGYKDEDGYIYIVDRADDLINIGGVKIYPREIEEVLYRHPAVQAAAVTGVPSTLHHEAIKAFIVLKPAQACTRERLQAFCRPWLADFKIPKYVEFVDHIPQGATGKILRKDLRARG